MKIVVMGVSGCGKSTVGAALAARLGAVWADGDDLQPAANVAKMAAGQPLSDADRWPWLDQVGAWLAGEGARVMGCSALRRAYRDRLRGVVPGLRLVFLHGDRALIASRMAARTGHYMPVSLLDSQFATLEDPTGEPGVIPVGIDAPPEVIVEAALGGLSAAS